MTTLIAALAGVWLAFLCVREGIRNRDLPTVFLTAMLGPFYAFDGRKKWFTGGLCLAVYVYVSISKPSDPLRSWIWATVALGWALSTVAALREADAESAQASLEAETRANNLTRRGKIGRGAVVRFEDTGVRLGFTSLFNLHVDLDGTDVVASCESDPAEIANWLGREVVVKYDPQDPTNAELISESSDAPTASATAAAPRELLAHQQALLNELNEHGSSAVAMIKRCEPCGTKINEDALMVTLTVTVQPDDAPSFLAEFSVAVSSAHLPRYQPGQKMWVRFDPNDLTRVTLDFERQGGTTCQV